MSLYNDRTGRSLSAQVQRQVWREIEGDVDRVFANGKSHVNSATGMASIRRLLRAYSIHNPAVGYCQGMNFVAGFLLEVRLIPSDRPASCVPDVCN